MEKPSFYAIIPGNVRYDKGLKPSARLLYGEITALCNSKGYCRASNEYFAELYDVTTVSISRRITNLVDKGYITRRVEYKKGTKQIEKRVLSIRTDPLNKNVNTPYQKCYAPLNKNVKDNNTFNNTINKKVVQKKNINPTEQEVINYFKEKGYKVSQAKTARAYYDAGDRKDSRGNKVKSWKQKMISVWMKPEFKEKIVSSGNKWDKSKIEDRMRR